MNYQLHMNLGISNLDTFVVNIDDFMYGFSFFLPYVGLTKIRQYQNVDVANLKNILLTILFATVELQSLECF